MSPLRRRSSRLRGSSVTPAKSTSYRANRLERLNEDDETPSTLYNIVKPSSRTPHTPTTAARIKPSLEEMHPSKVKHSTAVEPDIGLQLGFADVNKESKTSGSNAQTPSKTPVTNSSFDFRFARPVPQLGPEAQRMMDELREEALRIKAKLAAEREEQSHGQNDGAASISGRKIALPKGKAGRFSDIHMAEFKKMDSIAGHPSAFRAQSGRSTPVKTGLKRSQSRARLDEREDVGEVSKQNSSTTKCVDDDRLQNDAPPKRARKELMDDTSSARPVSRDAIIPATPHSESRFFASITTPTKSSLARVASVKAPTSQISSLLRSPSKSKLSRSHSRPILSATPQRLQKSATINNIGGFPRSESKISMRSPGRIDRLKSILRYPSSSVKKSSMVSAIPSFAQSPVKLDLDKALPGIPITPVGLSKTVKHVNFTPETVGKNASTLLNSPSPMKSGIPRSISKIKLHVKDLDGDHVRDFGFNSKPDSVYYPDLGTRPHHPNKVEYPSLTGLRPLPEPPKQTYNKPSPAVPGTFTFRSDHTINFGQSPTSFGSSPGQASVRQVRPSMSANMPGSFQDINKENQAPLASVPHGMSNKKRRRADSDGERGNDPEPTSKKRKAETTLVPTTTVPKIATEKNSPATRFASPAKKKGLSLSRLNMLARPKVRK